MFLILSRRTNEDVVIGEGADEVVVRVIEVRGDSVRLGIAAPGETRVDRAEVRLRIEAEREGRAS